VGLNLFDHHIGPRFAHARQPGNVIAQELAIGIAKPTQNLVGVQISETFFSV
jgi:hypothetical protein